MDPHQRALGLRLGFRRRLDNLAVGDTHLAGLGQRGTVAVDFRIAADFDELRRFPVVHNLLPRQMIIRDGFLLEQPKFPQLAYVDGE